MAYLSSHGQGGRRPCGGQGRHSVGIGARLG
jgi:hypothetical protein